MPPSSSLLTISWSSKLHFHLPYTALYIHVSVSNKPDHANQSALLPQIEPTGLTWWETKERGTNNSKVSIKCFGPHISRFSSHPLGNFFLMYKSRLAVSGNSRVISGSSLNSTLLNCFHLGYLPWLLFYALITIFVKYWQKTWPYFIWGHDKQLVLL